MSTNIAISDASPYSYDELPYESYPYAQTHPANLRTLGVLFGMMPVPLETARILELGCAAGNNILPLALDYPKAKIVGVDLSKVQIDQANKQVSDLKLKNIEFRHCSIMDIDQEFGEFDYIIAHGVLSWVPEDVQEKIFDICGTNLSPNGIAYISYNTLPGWNMVRSIRDMMLYHTQNFQNPHEKVQQSRLLLQFIIEATENSNSPYAQVLKNEAKVLANQPDHYLRHDHIEENNIQLYFHEFAAKAKNRKLQYLGDANIPTMYLGNMPAKVVEKLQAINDIVRTEQYMDFITNRRFRCSLLCKETVKLNRNLNNDDLKNFYISMIIDPEKALNTVNLNDKDETLKFFINNNNESFISSASPIMKAILYTFAENKNYSLKVDQVVKLASQKLEDADRVAIKNELLNNGMKLVLAGYMNICSEPTNYVNELTQKPKASKLIQYQAERMPGFWVTNQKHERLGINLFEKYVLRYLDGNNTKEEIIDKVMNHIKNDELTVSRDGAKITDDKLIREELSSILENTLVKFAPSAVLIG
jgi:methyltransferase-like protein/cyclopropane fatty-acyl-phospholipid synthase-like methyltransferase